MRRWRSIVSADARGLFSFLQCTTDAKTVTQIDIAVMKALLAVTAATAVTATNLGLGLYEWASQKVLGLDKSRRATRPALSVPYEELERWMADEANLAFESIIHNIGGYGDGLDNVLNGIVVASRSKSWPDYYYQWTRDAAITIDSLILRFNDQKGQNETLKVIIEDYITSSAQIQRVENPSGNFKSLEGLGEPKFLVDGRPFEAPWGRPQRDGPALRSAAIINYIDSQVKHNRSANYENYATLFYSVIKPDLDYVALKWDHKGFDFWEEINDFHFGTHLVQLRSLVLGTLVAEKLGLIDCAQRYKREASNLRQFIASNYHDKQRGHLVQSLGSDRTGLDAAIFIGTIWSLGLREWNGTATSDSIVFPPNEDAMIVTLEKLIQDMATRFPINQQRIQQLKQQDPDLPEQRIGVGVGRYPEDVYDGVGISIGNPWFITTATIAQILYLLSDHLLVQQSPLYITNQAYPFYSRFGITHKEIERDDPEYMDLTRSIFEYADSFMDVIREHSACDGKMSEQFNRYNGYMQGASELTWSYGAFWSAARQRNITQSRLNSR